MAQPPRARRTEQPRAGRVPGTPVAPVPPSNVVPVPPVDNAHCIETHGKHGFRQPKLPFDLYVAALSPIPKTFCSALAAANWREAMTNEYLALLSNNNRDLVPRPPDTNVVTGKWVYHHKFRSDGSLEHYKARWVLRGFT